MRVYGVTVAACLVVALCAAWMTMDADGAKAPVSLSTAEMGTIHGGTRGQLCYESESRCLIASLNNSSHCKALTEAPYGCDLEIEEDACEPYSTDPASYGDFHKYCKCTGNPEDQCFKETEPCALMDLKGCFPDDSVQPTGCTCAHWPGNLVRVGIHYTC